jgi:hypothetical protein
VAAQHAAQEKPPSTYEFLHHLVELSIEGTKGQRDPLLRAAAMHAIYAAAAHLLPPRGFRAFSKKCAYTTNRRRVPLAAVAPTAEMTKLNEALHKTETRRQHS